MRRLLTAIAAAAAAIALLSAPAGAVLGGSPDGNGHPNVGLSVFYYHDVPLWRCTGTMVAPTIYLTAGHCTGIDTNLGVTPDHAEVWFSPGPIPHGNYPGGGVSCAGYTGYPCQGEVGGTPNTQPGWNGLLTVPNTHDIGVVVLDTAPNHGLCPIAPAGYLDQLATAPGKLATIYTANNLRPATLSKRTTHKLSAAAGLLAILCIAGGIYTSGLWYGRVA